MGFMSMSGLEMTKLAALAAVTMALGAGPAAAQLSQSSDAPVDITADALEVVNNQCLSICDSCTYFHWLSSFGSHIHHSSVHI